MSRDILLGLGRAAAAESSASAQEQRLQERLSSQIHDAEYLGACIGS